MDNEFSSSFESFYNRIKEVLIESRSRVYLTANSEMVLAYWTIGRIIVQEEQNGHSRANYGKLIVETLSSKLTSEFGKGYNKSNLWNMIRFYKTFPIIDAVRRELNWTHYRILIYIENEDARNFYLKESIESKWSARQLERQINSLYFERILMTRKEGHPLLKKEVENMKDVLQPRYIIKDPYVLEFLDLKPSTDFYERDLEQALIDKLQNFLLELGKGFSFVSRQYRISSEGDHFYVDLVF